MNQSFMAAERDGHASNPLPLPPRLTPAFGIAGALLILTGLVYCVVGIKYKLLHIFLSCFYIASLGVTVLILYLMSPPTSDALQGAYFVASCGSGLVFATILLQFKNFTGGIGCFLGGFCIAMWFMTLRAGGLIQSPGGVIAFIVLLSTICYGISFRARTRSLFSMVGSSLAGATAIILGVDCYTRAGLKEFWAYIWRLNSHIFPVGTNTYPVTKGIRAEIGCIPVFFAIGLLFQYKVYKVLRVDEERKAAEIARINQEREQHDLEAAQRVKETTTRDLSTWNATFGEKNTPTVEQKPIIQKSSRRLAHSRSHGAKTHQQTVPERWTCALKDDSNTDNDNQSTPVKPAIERWDLGKESGDRSSYLREDYPSLRPSSGPPPPILPSMQSDGGSSFENIEYSCKDGREGSVPAEPFLLPPLPVSSLDLPFDTQDGDGDVNEQHIAKNADGETNEHHNAEGIDEQVTGKHDTQDADDELKQRHDTETSALASDPSMRSLGQIEFFPPEFMVGEDAYIFDFEHIPSGDEGDKNSIQNSRMGLEDANQQELMAGPEELSNPLAWRSKSKKALVCTGNAKCINDNLWVEEWTRTLDEAEYPESASEQRTSTRTSCANDDHVSLWSGFEGAYPNTSVTTPERRSQEQPLKGKGKAIITEQTRPISAETSDNSRIQWRRASHTSAAHEARMASAPSNAIVNKPSRPTRPAPVRSARVHHQNSSLPVLDTSNTLLDHQHAVLQQRQNFIAVRQSYANEDDNDDDDVLLSDRRISLQQRTTSSGQVSTLSSAWGRPSGSNSAQSPTMANTWSTPATSPMVSSSPHPPFIMTAYPLRGSYPFPPTTDITYPPPAASSPPILRRGLGPGPVPTLLDVSDAQQRQDTAQKRKQLRDISAAIARDNIEAKEEAKRRQNMIIEAKMRSGAMQDVHERAMRKMQRESRRSTGT